MSERVRVGDRFERHGWDRCYAGHPHYTPVGGVRTVTALDVDGDVIFDNGDKTGIFARWRRLPPADTGPQVGEVWFNRNGDVRVIERVHPNGDVTHTAGLTYSATAHARLFTPAPQPDAQTLSFYGVMPVPAAPMVGPASNERCCTCGAQDPGRVRYSERFEAWLCPTHLEDCLRRVPAPAAPTGAPAKVEPPKCQWVTNEHACSGPVLERWIQQSYCSVKCKLCDAHYLSAEAFRAGETDDCNKAFAKRKSSQPPRWWSPAIESLGGVRPFGRPRGMR